MASLQDQLLKAGLVDKKQAKDIQKAKKKQPKKKKGQIDLSESAVLAQQAQAEKQAKDRALNQQKNQRSEIKAIAAQIKQLIENNAIKSQQADTSYQFVDDGKIKKIYLDAPILEQLLKGHVSIVRFNSAYELIPTVIARKIEQRDADCIVPLKLEEELVAEDDPYKDYPIPDDLMW